MRIVSPLFFSIAALTALTACGGTANRVTPAKQSPGESTSMVVAATTVQTVQFFQSSFVFGGKTFTYKMVGSNPFTAPASVTIPTVIIPVELKFANGDIFNPANVVTAIRRSPFFHNGSYAAGTLQYGDAVMRSEFWKSVSGKNYHVLLGAPIVAQTFVLNVPSTGGSVQTTSGIKTALLKSQYFLDQIEPQLLASYHVSPAQLAIFAVAGMRVLEPSGHCCYNGFHSSFTTTVGTTTKTNTTVWALVDGSGLTDMAHMSHEIAEWLNDPFYPSHPNIVPPWVHPLAHVCDGNQLEVGDPLVTVNFTVNGYTVQDEAFLSWFSRTKPSIGIGGRYDLLGKLTGPAALC